MNLNHTTNFQLSQWESTDRILMSDFNSDNAKIDAALKAHSDAIAGKAAQSTVNSLSQTVNAKANQSDLTALTQTVSGKASQADLTALSQELDGLADQVGLRGNCQIYYTTYTGDGQTERTLTFPGKPLQVTVMGGYLILHAVQGVPYAISHNPSGTSSEHCIASWSGSSLTWSGEMHYLNDSGDLYTVVALIAKDE